MENVECSIPGCIATHSEGSTPAHLVPEPAPECPLIHPHHKVDCIRFEPFTEEDSILKRVDEEFPKFEADVCDVYENARRVLLKKHQDYGPTNISRSPGGPLNGLRVRMWDKLARINNLIDSGAEPENESLRDSFLDLMNYAAIAQVVLDGNWPEQ